MIRVFAPLLSKSPVPLSKWYSLGCRKTQAPNANEASMSRPVDREPLQLQTERHALNGEEQAVGAVAVNAAAA